MAYEFDCYEVKVVNGNVLAMFLEKGEAERFVEFLKANREKENLSALNLVVNGSEKGWSDFHRLNVYESLEQYIDNEEDRYHTFFWID